ncbi:hypothetical protein I4U23_027642 [Adineta vaga]|nr:hypothetical protein I4U23_027642 [Adineta vaga]
MFLQQHSLKITQLSTRYAQLSNELLLLEIQVHNQEQKLIFQMDLNRNRTQTISQLEACINSLFERYRLIHQTKPTSDYTMKEKLKSIQDFILNRMDLVNRVH